MQCNGDKLVYTLPRHIVDLLTLTFSVPVHRIDLHDAGNGGTLRCS